MKIRYMLDDRDRVLVTKLLEGKRLSVEEKRRAPELTHCLTEFHAEQTAVAAKRFRELAEERTEWGNIEFDTDAIVSFSDDGGAYVSAWVWIQDPNQKCCEKCLKYFTPKDEDESLCPSCQDRFSELD